jgi:tetratricopeptide (TPR) repeat protein
MAIGTPAYMAPEQVVADPHMDHRADIYAFGVVAYEVLTGRPPFTGTSGQAIMGAHATTVPEPVSKNRPGIPPALAALVMKCLEKLPGDRWQRADELLPHLEAVLTSNVATTHPAKLVSRRKSVTWLAGGSVVLAVLAVLGWLRFRRPPSVAPGIERLAVIPLENRTGNPAHEELGAMAAEWINRGLVDARLAEVVPTQVVRAAVAKAGLQADEALTTRVARETGATKLVVGAYYAAGDSIRFQAEFIDAVGSKSLAALEPVTVLPSAAMRAIEQLRQKTLGMLALRLDPVWGKWADATSSPPSLEAFRLYVRGQETFWRDPAGAQQLYRQALAIDSTWQSPRLGLVSALIGAQRWLTADSILRVVESSGTLMSASDRFGVIMFRGWLDGDEDAVYRAFARDSAVLGDGDDRRQFGWEALKLCRPHEALRSFAKVNPRSLEMSGIPQYWETVAYAHHALGDHAAELTAIREGRAQHPRRLLLAGVEASALAALGRIDEIATLADDARTLPPDPWAGSSGDLLSDAAAEFTAHGDTLHGREFANGSVEWYAARPDSERAQLRYDRIRALFLAGRLPEAESLLDPRCQVSFEGLTCLGWTGVLAARRGDSAVVRRETQAIEGLRLQPRMLQQYQAYWLAAIAAARGDLDRAVEQLRQAMSKGYFGSCVWLHRDPLFIPLYDNPAFKELLRPKG